MKKLLLTLLLCIGGYSNAEEKPLGLTFFGSFIHSDKAPRSLFFFSDIKRNDSFELRRALRTHDIETIVLASEGGSVWEALTMAGIIHDRQLQTFVPNLPNNLGCYSSCAYMFLGGTTRVASGRLGVHQVGAYDADMDRKKIELGATQQITQFTTSEVIGFLNEFKTPPWVFERMFRSREIYLFNKKEKAELSLGDIEANTRNHISSLVNVFINKAHSEQKDRTTRNEEINVKNKNAVKRLQIALNSAGCGAGPADGVWGRKTNEAARRFAAINKLSYSGADSISYELLTKLNADNRVSCPSLPAPQTLVGTWNFEQRCTNLGDTTGKAQITKRGSNYKIVLTTQAGGKFSGRISVKGRQISYFLSQLNGIYVIKGNGQISSNRRQISGSSKSCRFLGRKAG